MSERKWVTTQIVSIAPGVFVGGSMPVVALLLQHADGAPTETRVVAGIPDNSGKIEPVEDAQSVSWKGQWVADNYPN